MGQYDSSKVKTDGINISKTFASLGNAISVKATEFNKFLDRLSDKDNTVKVSLSSAEILTLYTLPKIAIPAPGVGKYIQVTHVSYKLNYNSTTYSNSDLEVLTQGNLVGNTEFWFSRTIDGASSIFQELILNSSGALIRENRPIILQAANSNPTTGNSTIDIYITYNIKTI